MLGPLRGIFCRSPDAGASMRDFFAGVLGAGDFFAGVLALGPAGDFGRCA